MNLIIAREEIFQRWFPVANKTLDAIESEPDPLFISQLLVCFYQSLDILGEKCCDLKLQDRILKASLFLVKSNGERRIQRNGKFLSIIVFMMRMWFELLESHCDS